MLFESAMMRESIEATGDILPPNPIRVETALSRYPVHRLAKHGDIAIDIREKNADGELSIKWEVTHNSKYGQPGPLAYKLDTLIINRRIEDASRPIPKIIRLGSLKEICREIGTTEAGKSTNDIKNSLYKNATTFITAKISYRQKGGGKRSLEAGFTRYSVVFTGEELPDGRKADAVYIILNDIYMQVINGAMTRPLDYDYLKDLPPAPQRFYELLSYQMYAAIRNDRPKAKLLYSEFCRYAPLTRHLEWERVRKQLAKIHAPHKKSGYIGRVDFQAVIDGEGQPDWIMFYAPGPKARSEYRAFAKRGGPTVIEVEAYPAEPAPLPLLSHSESSPLADKLIDNGVTPAMAAQLVREHSEEAIATQLEHLAWLLEKKPEKIADPAAWLVSAVRTSHAKPKGFVPKAERERRTEAKRQKEHDALEAKRRKREQREREQEETALLDAYWQGLSTEAQAELDAAARAEADSETLELAKGSGPMQRIGQMLYRRSYIRKLLEQEGRLPLPE